MPSTDDARKWTDAQLEALEGSMAREYRQAEREMRGKLDKSLKRYASELEQRERALDDTPEAREAFEAWKRGQAAQHTRMGAMADQYAQSAHQANVRAVGMVNGFLPRIFSENANRAAFSIDRAVRHDTSFTLVNEDAVRYLMGIRAEGADPTQLIRETVWFQAQEGREGLQDVRKRLQEVHGRRVDYAKDIRWNRQKFTSAITQGILQGESIPQIVRRTESIFGMNKSAAIRAARTACTNAENAGRMASIDRAASLGIDIEVVWDATLDERTREAHRELDGQRIKPGESFDSELGPIRYPGDPLADPANVWNCRCRADERVVGFDGKRGDWADEAMGERWSRLPEGMTYEEWKAGKPVSRAESYENEAGRVSADWYAQGVAEPPAAPAGGIVDGIDMTATWEPSGEGFAINDIVHRQGFDGVPRVVDADEFEQLAASATDKGLIMQRAYGAPTQEVLDSYREALYSGDFYVDCSGGHMYGRGMYASYADGTEPTRFMERQSERYAKAHGAKVGYVETMTLDKSARVISSEDLMAFWDDERIPKSIREGDDGALAAALGYDAIRVEKAGEMVVLNRTKLIIRRPE